MPEEIIEVGVVVARRRALSRWAEAPFYWTPRAVLPAAPPLAPFTRLEGTEEEGTWFAGAAHLSLHPGDTAFYRDNLTSGAPKVWVALRPTGEGCAILAVTVDPYEGETLAETVTDVVEQVPMDPLIAAQVQAFFDAHHVERPFFKRKRDRANPEALGRRGIVDARPRRGEDDE